MIQIDMQMPKNCIDCPACNEYLMCAIPINGRTWGENAVHEFGQGRPEWCPMKEQQEIVMCKDCKWHTMIGEMLLCTMQGKPHTYDWFCAGGKRA